MFKGKKIQEPLNVLTPSLFVTMTINIFITLNQNTFLRNRNATAFRDKKSLFKISTYYIFNTICI